MKIWQKAGALAIAASMMVGLAACGGGSATPTQAPAPTAEVKQEVVVVDNNEANTNDPYAIRTDANGNKIDLGGIEVVLNNWWEGEPTPPNNAYDEAREEYLDWLQKTYNFTFKRAQWSTWGDTPNDFNNYAMTGGDEYYMFTLRQGIEAAGSINQGLCWDLSKLDCLDFSDDKFDKAIMSYGKRGDSIYCMRAEVSEPRGGLYFNKRLLREAGIDPDQIYKLQEEGKWTWEEFEKMCETIKKDTDNDGVIDRWPMTNFASSFYDTVVASNHAKLIDVDADGNYISKIESNETLQAMNWAVEMRAKYEMPQPEGSNWDYMYASFANGEAAFQTEEAYKAGQYISNGMEDEFGFACFPKGPNADDYYSYSTDNLYVIPACYSQEKAWKIAFVYDLVTNDVPGYEGYPSWKYGYYNNFKDSEAVDLTLPRLMANAGPLFENSINGLTGNDGLHGALLWWNIVAVASEDGGQQTPAARAEAIRNTVQSYLDAANGK